MGGGVCFSDGGASFLSGGVPHGGIGFGGEGGVKPCYRVWKEYKFF